jgi:hypothetical protein
MNDFKSRKLNTARHSVTNKEAPAIINNETKSEKKKKISFNIQKDDNFKPTTRVRDMKELIERRYTIDATSTPRIMTEESKSIDININNLKYSFADNEYEECKSHRTIQEDIQPRIKRGSMRIYYMARALEDKLHQKREDKSDSNQEDQVFQIMMDKPLVSTKKPSRAKLTI